MPSILARKLTQNPEVTFAVDDVTPAEEPLWTVPLADSLSRRFARKIFVLSEEDQFVTSTVSRCHPLIDAVHVAFSQHRPLTLSPDAIWLVIAQGFAHHVTENAETLRPRLVRHQGRRELSASIDALALKEFQKAIANISAQIEEATDPVLHATLVCDFSTTTPAIRTASEVSIMDTFSSYFSYMLMCVCGIPKITLQGSPEDWQRIRARVEVLDTYALEWWVSRLRPILDEFVLTAEGHPAPDFWKAIYKLEDVYADQAATGWITDLFPYLGDAPNRHRNHVFKHERKDWGLPLDQGVETKNPRAVSINSKGVVPRSFPSGLSSVPLKIGFPNKSEQDVDLVAGFLAVKQDPSDNSLSPVIGWSVTEPPPKTPIRIFR